jgi:DNA polymerase-3 subunit delta
MAEKKTSQTFDAIMRDLKSRRFAPIYILMGEESYYIDLIADYISDNVLPEAERDFNQTIVYGADVTSAQIADLARRYPMMAEHQVVVVKEAQNLRDWSPIEKYAEKQVMKSTVLVLCYKNGILDRKKKAVNSLFAKVEACGGVIYESKKKRESELPAFIESYLKEQKATIDYKSCQMIADHIGSDLSRLASELDKVLISLPEGKRRITADIVEQEIGVSKEFNTFELRNAIINRDVFKANQIIKYFDSNPKSGSIYAFLPNIFNFFQNLMVAYYAPDKRNDYALAQYLELRGSWAAQDYMVGMKNYSGTKTLQIISKIREIDAKTKGLDNPNTGAGDLMKELIFFILH